MGVEVYFDDIERVILKELSNSKKQIYVAVAWLTNQKLFDKLCQMADNYIDVQILIVKDEINLNSSCDYEKLVKLGGKVFWQEDGRSLMHHKFCIIDGNVVITGSYNWTIRAQSNIENISIIKDEKSATDKYLNEFKNLLPTFSEANFYESGFKPAEFFDNHEKRHKWFSSLSDNWKETLLYYANSYLWDKPGNTYWDYDLRISIVKEMEYEDQLEAIFKIKEIICPRDSSLRPLEHLTNIEIVTRLGNGNRNGDDISDLSPLNNLLNLKELELEFADIKDLRPLEKLKKLTKLTLSSNPLKSLDGIQNLERISVLWINRCNLKSLEPIYNYKMLKDFRFSGNSISNIDFLSNNNRLQRVEFSNNKVNKINFLANCSELENITFYNNEVSDISELHKLKKLIYIYPSGNPIPESQILEFRKKSKAFVSDYNK